MRPPTNNNRQRQTEYRIDAKIVTDNTTLDSERKDT
jgi:hypothetical protein